MSKSMDIDRAAACVRNIVDNNRCGTCDKLEYLRRHSICGHIVCENCAAKEEDCIVCLPASNTSNVFALDESLVKRSSNASMLLNAFEDTFKTDVYRRHRLSEQLKIEKEVFPECIQAPAKYINKRKSLNTSIANKENRKISFFLGEEVSPSKGRKMEKSKYIQKWLNDSDMTNKIKSPRKPFSDISVNEQHFSTNTNNVPLTKIRKVKNTENIVKRNKASKIKKSVSKNKRGYISKYLKTVEQENICQEIDSLTNIHNSNSILNNTKCKVQDESGIVIDDDCIVLDDTQKPSIDKDALALQAVLEADQKETSDYVSFLEHNVPEKNVEFIKVPYFLKSPLYKTCRDCNGELIKTNPAHHSKHVSITIVYNMTDHKESTKQSTSVQTELSDIEKKEMDSNFISSNMSDKGIYSDMVNNDVNEKPLGEISKKSIIIEESDSEFEPESLLVTAEVHRSCEEDDYGVLCDLSLADLTDRKRPSARRTTPSSTDSSDKENFDPNRVKRFKCDKKHSKKQKINYKI